MNRRRFLKILGIAPMAAALPAPVPEKAAMKGLEAVLTDDPAEQHRLHLEAHRELFRQRTANGWEGVVYSAEFRLDDKGETGLQRVVSEELAHAHMGIQVEELKRHFGH